MRSCEKLLGLLLVATGLVVAFDLTAYAADEPASEGDVKGLKKTLESAIKELAETRDKLAAKLGDRVKSDAKEGRNCDMFLRFDEGADEEETFMMMSRRGKQWLTSYAVVPRWRQESFHELFAYVHRGRNRERTYDKWRFAVDMSDVAFDGKSLGGQLTARYQLDTTKTDLYPPGTPTRWSKTGQKFTTLEKLFTLNHEKDQVQTYKLKAKMLDGVYEFDLWLVNAIQGRATLQTRFQVPAQPWIRGTVWGLNWNCGYHGVDASALEVKDGVLSGPLMVSLNPDAWFPKKPHYMVYNLEAKISGRLCEGTFEGQGDFGECSGKLQGEAGEFITGTYEASGDMGDYGALVFGRIMPAREKISDLLSAGKKADDVPALAARAAELYNEIRALCLATRQYPLPVEHALVQTKAPGAEWKVEDKLSAEQVASISAYAENMKELVESCVDSLGKESDAVVGMPDCGDPSFGPYGTVTALSSSRTNTVDVPAVKDSGPQKWACIPRWQVVSPFPRYDDMDHNTAELPDIVPADGALYEITMGKTKFNKGEKRPKRMVKTWSSMAAPGGKLTMPWSRISPRGRSQGAVWFARTILVSEKAQEIWVAFSAEAQGKLWVNGKLAWVGPEKRWRNWRGRESIFKISLEKGENRLLARGREDRHEAYMRAFVCIQGAPDPESRPLIATKESDENTAGGLGDGSGRFARATNPPLAWDIEKGVNVAWNIDLPGSAASGVAAADGKLFVCCAPNLVVCLDQEKGKVLWEKELGTVSERSRGEVITDGKMVWACLGAKTAGYDLKGKEKWTATATGERCNLALADGKLLVESGSGQRDEAHTCAAYDAAGGKEQWKVDVPGGYNSFGLHVIRLRNGGKEVTGVIPESLQVLSLENGKVLCNPPDTDARPGSRVYFADDMLIFAKRSKVCAHKYMLDTHGQVVVAPAWRNGYGIKYDSHMMVLMARRYCMMIGTVQEDCKGHSPAAIRELYAYDRDTGRPVKRIKPLLLRSEIDGSQSTYAAPYVFIHDRGGGSAGGHDKYGQIGIVRIDNTPTLVSRNYIALGTGTPVFDSDSMFLVKGTKMWRVAVTDDQGRKYQDEKLAEMLFERLWNVPKSERFAMPKPFEEAPEYGTIPLSRIENNVGLPHWMVAGPYPLPDPENEAKDNAVLAALRPNPGDGRELGGTKRRFEALTQENVSVGYNYGHMYYLCGIGGTVATVFRKIDVLSCTGGKKDQCGILYTVVANNRPRVASIMMPAKGVDVWLGGIKLKPFQAVQMEPGAYPLVARVRPDKMGRKPGGISIAFRNRDDPRAAKRYWLSQVNKQEEAVKRAAKALPGSELGEKAEMYLQELGEYKAFLDLENMIRSARNGAGMFINARPPVPWERAANLKWRADLPGEPAAAPVAAGDNVYVSAKPNLVVACNRANGKIAWKAEVPKASGLSAPVTTKDAVYVADASGAVARFRLNGTAVWTEKIKGASGTPVVVPSGDILVVQAGKLFGVDMNSGKTTWSEKSKGGAPTPITLAGKAAILTCDGTILNSADGRVLVTGLPATGSVTPQFVRDTVYSASGSSVAAHRVAPGRKPEKLWEDKAGGNAITSPIVYDGFVYVLTGKGDIRVLSAADGKSVGKHTLAAKPKEGVSDLLLGGMHLFAVNLGDGSQTVVLKPGEKIEKVWEYSAPGASVAPCFLANGQFVPAGKTLFCIDGKPPAEPGEYTPLPEIKASSDEPGKGVPVVKFADNQMPAKLLFGGPVKPQSLEEDFLKAIGGRENPKVEAGKKIKFKDQEFAFQPVEFARSVWSHPKFTAGFDSIDVRTVVTEGQKQESKMNDHTTIYLYAVINNDKPRFVELRDLTPGDDHWNKKEQMQNRFWLGGKEIKVQDVVEIEKGRIPFLIQVSVGTCDTSGGKIWMAPRLIDKTDKYGGEKQKYLAARKVWDAYAAAKDKPFVLK